MTKLKNTKKGMAKKALSISLVAAMLATSNVPVWAAEDLFSDGSAAVEAPAVEEPAAEVDTFSAEPVEETVANNLQDVEETTENAEVLAADSSISNPKTTLTLTQSGWANTIDITGDVYDKDGNVVNNFSYAWAVDGKVGNRQGIDYGTTTAGTAGIWKYNPTQNDIGKNIELRIYEVGTSVIGNDDYVAKTNSVTISKANVDINSVSNYIAYNINNQDINHRITYSGKAPTFNKANVHAEAKFDNITLETKDFTITRNLKSGNGIDAGSVYTITATPTDSSLYTGTLQYDYTIVEKDFELGDISLSLNKSYEYTGNRIIPDVNDIQVVDTLSGNVLNSEEVIASIDSTTTDPSNVGTKIHSAIITLNNVPNYTENSIKYWVFNNTNTNGALLYSVTARDLANCDIKVDTIAFTGKVLTDNDARFNGKIHFFDKTTGEELNLVKGTDYTIHVSGQPTDGTKNYTVEIKSNNGNTTGFQSVNFQLGNQTFDSEGYTLTTESKEYLEKSVAYTGKTAVKDTSKIVFMKGNTKLSPENYEVTVSGVDAGTGVGKVVIKGLKSYADCEEVYYFDITPAVVHEEDVSVAAKVIFNKGYTKAAQYAPSVTVKACTTGTTDKTFTLSADDIKVSYSFDTTNMIGETITTKVQILNKNFKGGETVFELKGATEISKRDISNCTAVAEPGSYVYTGGTITPTLKVMDGDEPLTEGVDYEIVELINAKDVGTATAIIKGIGDNDNPADGIYDENTTKKVTFEITPANAEDIVVEFAGGNTGIKYTGTTIKPTILKVTLNGNDVSKQFDYVYPTTNVNVGKGHVILKPVTDNKNFTGTKDAEFDIVARELEGTLKVYDEKGNEYSIVPGQNGLNLLFDRQQGEFVSFAYDGKEHTLADAEFIPSGDYAKYVTKDDYEIVYIDNVYGKVIGAEQDENFDGYAYIAVIGKGNFTGTEDVTDSSGDVFTVVKDAAYNFYIEKYEIKKQHVTVSDGEYAAGQPVRPNVEVVVGGRTLVENEDYKLLYTAISDLTNGKTMNVEIVGVNGYKGSITAKWGVVKRNMENTKVVLGSGPRPSVTVYNSGIVVPASEYSVSYETDRVVITANEDSKYYTGSTYVNIEAEQPEDKPSVPMIQTVKTSGNNVSVTLAGESEDAEGYDFVISTDRNCIVSKDYDGVSKNILSTKTSFTYVEQGTYYAYCHAWKRVDGVKVFSDWSEAYPFSVTAITPEQPVITKVEKSSNGKHLRITWNKCDAATGYDVVMGTKVQKVNGELRPVEYGKAVKKITNGDTVSVIFYNIPSGTYYVGLHAYNRTSETSSKVFSKWSTHKTVKF